MRATPTMKCLAVSLATFLHATAVGYSQSACKSIDEAGPGALAARSADAFREASPEALSVFRELSRNPPSSRIVGGHVTLIVDNPWQVALVRANPPEPQRSQFCGGSIIANEWILTAAHCIRNSIVRDDPARLDVVAGTSQWPIGGERLKVKQIVVHPSYNEFTTDFDFALLRLQSPVTKGQIIATAGESTQVEAGTETCVSGWGATFEGGPGSIDLLGAKVPIVSNDVCNRPESYNGDITANMLCAGKREGGVDSCQGDSGGPLSAVLQGRNVLVGVVSFGHGCARRLKYGVYSRISAVAPWIATTMGAAAPSR